MTDQPESPTRPRPNKRIIKIEGCGDSFQLTILMLIIVGILFSGEPSIHESAMVWIGKEAGTIPDSYQLRTDE